MRKGTKHMSMMDAEMGSSSSSMLLAVEDDSAEGNQSVNTKPMDKNTMVRQRQPPAKKRLTMPNVVSPLLSLIVDLHGAQTIPSIFDSVARKSIFGLRKQDAPKVNK